MIKKKWDPKKGKHIWGYDITLRDPVTGKKTRRLRHYECETRDEAEDVMAALLLADREAKYGLRPLDTGPTVTQLIEKRLDGIENRTRRIRETTILNRWLKLLPSDLKVRDVKGLHIKLYLDKRLADGKAPSTADREVKTIGSLLHQAGESFESLEQWKSPKIPRLKGAARRRNKIISPEEYGKLIGHLTRYRERSESDRKYQDRIRAAQMIHFAMHTAMRHGEILRLRWSSIDWASDPPRAIIFQGKTGNDKHIPLTQLLVDILYDRKRQSQGELVFTKDGRQWWNFYHILRRACKACGIPYGRDVADGLVLHSARHTVTTRLADAGLDIDTIRLITGHSTRTIVADYMHYTPESIRRATQVLETIGNVKRREGR